MNRNDEMEVFRLRCDADRIAQEAMLQMEEAGIGPYARVLSLVINGVMNEGERLPIDEQMDLIAFLDLYVETRREVFEEAEDNNETKPIVVFQ